MKIGSFNYYSNTSELTQSPINTSSDISLSIHYNPSLFYLLSSLLNSLNFFLIFLFLFLFLFLAPASNSSSNPTYQSIFPYAITRILLLHSLSYSLNFLESSIQLTKTRGNKKTQILHQEERTRSQNRTSLSLFLHSARCGVQDSFVQRPTLKIMQATALNDERRSL